jgi:hypothetical protein
MKTIQIEEVTEDNNFQIGFSAWKSFSSLICQKKNFVDRALSRSVTCYTLLEPRTGLKIEQKSNSGRWVAKLGRWVVAHLPATAAL